MLQLTADSSSTIRKLLAEPFARDGGLRIVRSDGTDELKVLRAQAPREGDQVVGSSGARVFLDGEAADLLNDKVLHVAAGDDGKVRFLLADQH